MRNLKHVCIALLGMLTVTGASAATVIWTNAAGGDWTDNDNWSNAVPGSGDAAYFDLDSPGIYSVTNIPDGTVNQRVTVARDKVRLELEGDYELTDTYMVIVSTPGNTGTLEIVGGTLTAPNKTFSVGGGWSGSGSQHGILTVDGTVVGITDEVNMDIGSRGGGTGEVTLKGGATFTTDRGIGILRLLDGINNILISDSGTSVKASRLQIGSPYGVTAPTLNTCIVTNGALLSGSIWDTWIGSSGGYAVLRATGAGSEIQFAGSATDITIGTSNGKGRIEVLNGAYLRDGTSNAGNTYFGTGGSSRGSLLVEGANSRYRVEMAGGSGIYAYFRGNGCTCVVRDGGRITRDNGSKLIFEAGSFLGGDGELDLPVDMAGTIKPGGTLDNGGWYDVTSGTGTLTFGTNLTMSATAECQMELSGAGAGAYDSLAIGGNATIDGTLTVSLIGGYDPPAQTVFTLLSYLDNGSTTFSATNLPALDGGKSWDFTVGATATTLKVLPPKGTILTVR